DTKQPDPVETLLREPIKRGVVDVSQGYPSASLERQPIEPDARIDLIKGWIARNGRHDRPLRRLSPSAKSSFPAALEKGLGIELAKNVDQAGDDPGPTRLMAGTHPGAVVTMEVLIEQQIVLPIRIALELLGASKDRPSSALITQK